MSPSSGHRASERQAPRASAVAVRLSLIVGIVTLTAGLVGSMALPAAVATTDVIAAVRSDILDVAPMGEAAMTPQNSYVYDANGQELAELTFEENRVPVALDEIPQVVIDAVLATEDASFYSHDGVHHLAILRAAFDNFRAGGIESGASTITQQYVKLAFLTPEQTYQRKIEEAVYALEIERQLTKDQILELYLNRSYFGSSVYGIGTAAERYFSKDIKDVTLSEAATLAGIIRSPERNNPIANLENARDRRDIVLRQMANHGFISTAQAQAAIEEPLVPVISEPPPPEYPFWTDWVSRLLINEQLAANLGTQMGALEAMGATSDERRRRVFQSGLRIHTTLDPDMQEAAEAAILEHLTYEDEPLHEVAQEPMGSLVSVEPGTGAIRALAIGPHTYGSCTEDDSWIGETDDGMLLCDRTKVNLAVKGGGGSGRQPGSAYKPFLIAAALEDGVPPSLTLDARGPQDIEGCVDWESPGGSYTVRNAGGDDILNMYEAVARSSNVFHALLVAEIGPEKLVNMSHRLGITSDLGPNCSLALGAADVTPLEMATAYATIANSGEYCAPFPITRIEDADGRLLWEHSPDCRQVLDPEHADRLIDILAGPVSGGGTAGFANLGQWPTRGKTGTTNDNVDAWFVGFVRQLATAAWVGYPNGQRFYVDEAAAEAACGSQHFLNQCPPERKLMRGGVTIAGNNYGQVFGGTIAAPMWRTYMAEVVQQFEPQGFPSPGPMPRGNIPDLMGIGDEEEAKEFAIEAGFRVMFEEVEDHRPEGEWFDQDPEPGTEAPLGALITILVSDGTGSVPTVPNIVGMERDEARELIRSRRLEYGTIYRDVDNASEHMIVLDQRPDPGTEEGDSDFGDDPRVIMYVGRYE